MCHWYHLWEIVLSAVVLWMIGFRSASVIRCSFEPWVPHQICKGKTPAGLIWRKWLRHQSKRHRHDSVCECVLTSHWVSKASIQGGQTAYQMEWGCTWIKGLFLFITSLSFTFLLCHKMQRLIKGALTKDPAECMAVWGM